ncbi:Beta-barrel assembly machine subunit BamA [Marinospirillum celere]|uniref:Outer membrane protein assembly factor BamA n=1 Tax=Marinospirillum celere TaxID=1122252 RepID=A0A1I1IPW1_9GAMM|nr:outer membrane protein assembly factor BamA [Marinospirillum celere]SFC38339.1 Beta-barrel assembly machine subunit BamA [Marinospirillum celere]
MKSSSTLACITKSLTGLALGLGLLLTTGPAFAQEQEIVIEDLRIQGLQRVSPGSVFAELPLQTGDQVLPSEVSSAGKRLYATGLFDDLKIFEDRGVITFELKERPTLNELVIEGNQKVSSDDLKSGLRQAGLQEGQIFQRSTLDQIKLELQRMYHAQGRYNARIESTVEELPRNQVRVRLDITEGSVATIRRINIVGNEAFDNETLVRRFELQEDRGWTLFSSADQYSRERLSGDLERLRSWYLDRGYLRFNIESTQVSISPDKQDVFITVNVHEGEQYTVSEVELAGDLILEEDQLRPLQRLQAGDTFSRSAMTSTSETMRRRLGIEGYTFAEVSGRPEIDDENLEVKITFLVEPGSRMYVRKVNFRGNTGTQDEVLRREMLQMEGASANTDLIQASKARLERLGYFSQVEVETSPVSGSDDLVDVNFTVEEQPSGSISASVGYSQASGIVFGAAISQRNFLGTGSTVSFNANKSDFRTSYNFSYLNPYYTIDGVSRGFNVFYRETDFDALGVTNFATDAYGGNVTYGYPISHDSRLSLSVGFDKTGIRANQNADQSYVINEIDNFNELYGLDFLNYKLTGRWTQNKLNRGILATAGSYQRVSLEVAIPESDYEFYKVEYRGQRYFQLADDWSLKFRTEIGYGDGLGSDFDRLPFYEHYYAGGLNSVRGYRTSRLGPRNSAGNAFGGNLLTEGSVELIFPLWFVEDRRSIQTSFFVDGGNVFTTRCYGQSTCERGFDENELRFSAGVSLTWLTAIGPLAFSIAEPLNDQDGDETEFFQFSIGQVF